MGTSRFPASSQGIGENSFLAIGSLREEWCHALVEKATEWRPSGWRVLQKGSEGVARKGEGIRLSRVDDPMDLPHIHRRERNGTGCRPLRKSSGTPIPPHAGEQRIRGSTPNPPSRDGMPTTGPRGTDRGPCPKRPRGNLQPGQVCVVGANPGEPSEDHLQCYRTPAPDRSRWSKDQPSFQSQIVCESYTSGSNASIDEPADARGW